MRYQAREKTLPQQSRSRSLDQYIVRFPDGMRDQLKAAASENNRSMNAEIVARLSDTLEGRYLELSDEGIVATVRQLVGVERALWQLFTFYRDVDLDGFIADESKKGNVMERTEAVEYILRSFLGERGYVVAPPGKRRGLTE